MVSDPIRSCLGCRERDAAAALLRVAWDDTKQQVVWDVRRRLGGRGAWLHPRPDCLESALRRRAFGRALRRTVTSAETDGLAGGPPAWLPTGPR